MSSVHELNYAKVSDLLGTFVVGRSFSHRRVEGVQTKVKPRHKVKRLSNVSGLCQTVVRGSPSP